MLQARCANSSPSAIPMTRAAHWKALAVPAEDKSGAGWLTSMTWSQSRQGAMSSIANRLEVCPTTLAGASSSANKKMTIRKQNTAVGFGIWFMAILQPRAFSLPVRAPSAPAHAREPRLIGGLRVADQFLQRRVPADRHDLVG